MYLMINFYKKTRLIPFPSELFIFKNFYILNLNTFSHLPFFSFKNNLQFLSISSGYGSMFVCTYPVSLFITNNSIAVINVRPKPSKVNQSLSTFINLVDNLIKQVSFGCYMVVQFIGFRYRQRWFRGPQALKFKIGYNSRVWFKTPLDFCSLIKKISPRKRVHYYFTFDLPALRHFVHALYLARPATLYKGRGVNLKEQPMVLHEGKKAIW